VRACLFALSAVGFVACHSDSRVLSAGSDIIALQEVSHSGPQEPRVSAHGSDVSELPALFPDGDWLPIEAPLLSMAVVVKVRINGETATATLDTGAMGTTMSRPVAERLGIIDDDSSRGHKGRAIRAIDAHGNVIMGEKIDLGEVAIGHHRWLDVEVTVLGDQPELCLIGAELLQERELFLAADEGIVGVFAAGHGPIAPTDRVVSLRRGERQLLVGATAKGTHADPVQFSLIVDTGAWNTSVPLLVGINGGLPADVGYESTTVAVGGEQTNRGRFVMDPMMLGPDRVVVGKVLAIGSTLDTEGGLGLLGNDVMMRQHTLLSFARSEMRFKAAPQRPPYRTRGPGGIPCSDGDAKPASCVSVAVIDKADDRYDAADLPGVCMQIDIDEEYAGRTVELAITGASNELMNGGAIRAFLTANDNGAHACFHLWRQLERIGLSPSTPLSLRWVRTEGVQWPCDPMKTRCITFTGPLAKLPTK
jgi:hypothetical protein